MKSFHSRGMSDGFGAAGGEDCGRASGAARARHSNGHASRAAKRLLAPEQPNPLEKRGFKLSGTPRFLLGGPAFDQVAANMIAESGRGGDRNRAAGGDFYRRINDVFLPIALAGRYVSGQRVAGERRDGDVVGSTDAGFEHAAAPDRDVAGQAQGLNLPGA